MIFDNIINNKDKFLQPEGSIIHPLEIAARECDRISALSNNIWVALAANRCSIAIRSLPEWRPYYE